MRSRLDAATERAVATAVTDGWHVDLAEFEPHLEGAGAYHWHARGNDSARWFVTCDDLDTKPWLGSERDAVFDRLRAAYAVAAALRASGASFVVAPAPNAAGDPAVRIDDRHSVSVFEHVEGIPGQWGEPLSPATRNDLVSMLARLHSTPLTGQTVEPRPFELPDRGALDEALDSLGESWNGGPLSDGAREVLAANRDAVRARLGDIDEAAARIGDVGRVVTHGEPHPGNLIFTPDGLRLVDWDTVALAPPERDLWMLAAIDAAAVAGYEKLTGRSLDRELLTAYRQLWAVSDIAAFTVQLRRRHDRNEDTERALMGLHSIITGREPRPYG